MVALIIRAVEERRPYLNELIQQIPDARIIWDRYHDPMETFIRALQCAEDAPALHLEEDAILCTNFSERASAVIQKHKHEVVQFFSMHPADPSQGSRYYDHFVGAVCFYLPAGYSRWLAEYAPRWPKRFSNPTAVDIMLRHWMRKERNNEPHWLCIPNLADHRVGPSSIDPTRPERRQSLTYEPE